MADVQPTELVELDVEKVSGVEKPASGTTFLVLKASGGDGDDREDCATCDGAGKIRDGHVKCPDCGGTGQVAKAQGDAGLGARNPRPAAISTSNSPSAPAPATAGAEDMAVKALTQADRDKMPASSFAYVDAKGGKHLPVHDEAHVRAAIGRLSTQDFSGAKGSAADAKAAAARKIKAAAGKHGIEIDDESDLAAAAKKGAVQDALNGTATPERAGYDPTTGQSGTAGPVTAGATRLPEPRTAAGGASTYTIPAEDQQDLTKTAGPGVAFAVSSLVDAIERLAEIRDLSARATKAGMTLTPPSPDESAQPGSMPWESYDSATLTQVAQCLASCDSAISAIIARERAEASSIEPDYFSPDYVNAWDLQDAQQAMDAALGIVARLSFTEAAEADKAGDVAKAGRRLSGKTESALRAARNHLTSVIGDGDDDKAGDGDSTSEGDKLQMEVTKSELAQAIVAGVREVLKNANNGGDIGEGDIHDNGTVGDDLALAGSTTTRPGVTKQAAEPDAQDVTKQQAAPQGRQDEQDVTKQLKALTDTVGELGGLVAKMARAPRGGGPILTGQLPAGLAPAAEGRQGEVAKSAEDQEIERLEKALQQAGDPMARQHLSMTLTQRKLAAFHRTAGV